MRTPSDPVARLAKLEAARANIEAGETFNAGEMAEIAGMSWRNLKQIIDADPGFPIVQRGSEGVPWQFDGAAVIDHMIALAQAVQAGRERRRDRVTELAGLGGEAAGPLNGGGSAGSGSAARELMEDARALSAIIDVQAKLRAEKVAQGRLLDRAQVDEFLWRWLSGLQSDVLAIEGKIDRAGKLDVAVRAAIKDELGSVLVALRTGLEKQIGTWDAPRH